MKKKLYLSVILVSVVLLIDQLVKIWVKTHMQQGDEFLIFNQNWARIHFIENEGMAFGLSLGGATGKLILSVFRIVAISFLVYLLSRMIKMNEKLGLIISFSLILAGAIGNMLDSAFYGLIFSNSSYHGGLAELFPASGGYAPFLMGRVVDMFYFPMIESTFPHWFPVWGGQEFEFFRHIFNVADSSIFCGICLFFIFYRGHQKEQDSNKAAVPDPENEDSLSA